MTKLLFYRPLKKSSSWVAQKLFQTIPKIQAETKISQFSTSFSNSLFSKNNQFLPNKLPKRRNLPNLVSLPVNRVPNCFLSVTALPRRSGEKNLRLENFAKTILVYLLCLMLHNDHPILSRVLKNTKEKNFVFV